jgi:hypothetical protein
MIIGFDETGMGDELELRIDQAYKTVEDLENSDDPDASYQIECIYSNISAWQTELDNLRDEYYYSFEDDVYEIEDDDYDE